MGGAIGGGVHQSRSPSDAGEPSGAIKKNNNKIGRKSSSVHYSDAVYFRVLVRTAKRVSRLI